MHRAYNAWLDLLEAGILAELAQNIGELKQIKATIFESWVDVFHIWRLCHNHT